MVWAPPYNEFGAVVGLFGVADPVIRQGCSGTVGRGDRSSDFPFETSGQARCGWLR